MSKPLPEHCFECGAEEHNQHKIDCGSKRVFDAYLVLRDTNKYPYFSTLMLQTLEFNVWSEMTDRKYKELFPEEENKHV